MNFASDGLSGGNNNELTIKHFPSHCIMNTTRSSGKTGRRKRGGGEYARNVLHCLEARELVRQSELLSRCKVHGCFTGILIYLARVWGASIFLPRRCCAAPSLPPPPPLTANSERLGINLATFAYPPRVHRLRYILRAGTNQWNFNDHARTCVFGSVNERLR